MQGTIISITERYGFIRNGNGVSHHFSPRSMLKGESYESLSIGKKVTFEPEAGPKGMRATRIKIVPSFSGRSAAHKFLVGKEGDHVFSQEDLQGEHYLARIQSQWYKSPSDAKDELFNCVKMAGANCLVNLTLHKRTFSEGNYNYTMHSWSGLAGVYFSDFEYETQEEAEAANAECLPHAEATKHKIVEMEKALSAQRARQESSGGFGLFIIVAFVVICLIAFLAN